MSTKTTTFFAAMIAALCMISTSHAQSGSRNAAPVFSAPPAISSAPASSGFAPAASPLQVYNSPVQSVAPAAQPFTSGCTNCQMNSGIQSAPVVNYAPTYSAPTYQAQTYSAPVYSAPVQYAPTYSAPVYQARPIYSPQPQYRPVYRSYAPRFRSSGCGGY